MDPELRAELERRLDLIEDPDSGEAPLPPLPAADLAAAIAGLALLTALLLWWVL